ncbi:aminopeptidase O [Caerostris extrusa]|uniref:Aminopeptidase O n=1 Tax=Caerostris extrusa TaxID=172846 RepID=A0AAV4TX50_CAEEX|nr:aminopeptidase O [Caerostris extrusa]
MKIILRYLSANKTVVLSAQLLPDQTVLLLENLLSVERLRSRTLESLDEVFHFATCNAEVVHRWMELVVKHRHSRQYAALRDYLVNHMAMGVYLYGELIYSGDEAQETIAKECFSLTQEGMEPNFRHTIQQMFVLASES